MQIFSFLVIILTYLCIFIPGYMSVNINMMLGAVVIVWALNMMNGLLDVKKNVVFLLFNFTYFTFLIARPVIGFFRGGRWWSFDDENGLFVFLAIMLGLTFMYVGQVIGYKLLKKGEDRQLNSKEVFNSKNIRIISLAVYLVSFGAYMLLEFEKLLFNQSHTYLEYYTGFTSSMPYYVYIISTFFKYSLCMFLVTKPKKREAFIPLAMYFVSAIPELIIGIRNPIVLNAIFIFLYYCIRDIMGDEERWLGKVEISLLIITIPFAMAFLGLINYTRKNEEVNSSGLLSIILDLFYKQGVTFEVLAIGYAVTPSLPVRSFRNYTFGGFIDYFLHGTIGQMFGGKPLPSGNNIEQGLYSNSYAHNMSYAARGQEYLDGHGWGSSYLLETYTDYGYAGIIISSLLLGFFCVYVLKFIQKNKYTFYISLLCLTNFFFTPRAETTGWLTFILTAQFWVSTIFITLGAKLCIKTYCHKNLKYIGGKTHV